MDKLLKLKKFLTLEETRIQLDNTFEADVTMADVYRWALDGHLTISVNFLGMIVMSPGRIFEDTAENVTPEMIITKGMVVGEDLKESYSIAKNSGFPMSLREWLFFGREIMYANGVWDLAMLGQEYEYIESLYHREVGGIGSFDGFSGRIKAVVLKRYDSFCQLKDIQRPSGMPEREVADFINNASDEDFFNCLDLESYPHQLVIRTDELTRFIQSLQDAPSEIQQEDKPLSTKEYKTLLIIIYALLKRLDIDFSERTASSKISRIIDRAGKTLSLNTIRKVLRQLIELKG